MYHCTTLPRRPGSLASVALVMLGALTMTLAPRVVFGGQSARLVYSRTIDAAACSDEQGLRQAVARRLGYDPFVASSANTVVAELRSDGEGLRARVYVIRDGNLAGGARELSSTSRDCTELISVVALAMSIAIDPDALERVEQVAAAEPGGGATPKPHPVAASENPPKPAPDGEPPRDTKLAVMTPKNGPSLPASQPAPDLRQGSSALSGTLGLGVFLASGLAPPPSFGVALVGGLRLNQRWVVLLEPQLTLPSSRTADFDSSIRVRVRSYGATFAIGYQTMGWYAAGLFEAGQLASRGEGVLDPKTDSSWYAAAGLRLAYRLNLSRSWAVVPRADGLIALNSLNMQLNNGDVYDTPRLVGRFGLALETEL